MYVEEEGRNRVSSFIYLRHFSLSTVVGQLLVLLVSYLLIYNRLYYYAVPVAICPRKNLSFLVPPLILLKMTYFQGLIRNQCNIKNGLVVKFVQIVVILVLLWTLLYILLSKEILPTGDLFKLIALVIVAYIVGTIVSYIKLPPLLGMLLTGVCLKSVGYFEVHGVYKNIVAVSRDVALAVILIKAGLGLDANALKKNSFTVIRLALCPCIAETLSAAVVSHYVTGLPWIWGLLLGSLLSAISPAVVVPTLLSLKERGYGEDKGIPTLIIAASSIDDIASISLFGIFLAVIFSPNGDLTMKIVNGPLELVMGLAAGIVWGFVSTIIPHKDDAYVGPLRCAMVGGGGLCAVLGSEEIGYPGAGPLACLTAAFVAGFIWKLQGWSSGNAVTSFFSVAWLVMQPILFSLIGTAIDLRTIQLRHIGYGVIILIVGLAVRVCVCSLVILGSKLSWKEMLFVNLAWLPKATVQAALSPQALDLVRKEPNPSPEDVERGTLLLTVAVIAILITAPLGSIAISLSGPHLLTKDKKDTELPIANLRP